MPHLRYHATFKHQVLLEYREGERGRGFHALAARFKIQGGGPLVQRWYQRWDGSAESLQRRPGSGRPRVLSAQRAKQTVHQEIEKKRRKHEAVAYVDILHTVREQSGTNIALRTVQKYGKKDFRVGHRHTVKRTKKECERRSWTEGKEAMAVATEQRAHCCALFLVFSPVSASMCDEIEVYRGRIRRMPKSQALFLDETACRLNEGPTHTLVLQDDDGYVEATDTTTYAARYDMIACVSGDRVFPPIIYSPDERKQHGVKGINAEMLNKYIENILAQAIGSVDLYPLKLYLDRARIHKTDKMLETFHLNGAQNLTEVVLIPASSAKRMSPLDNSLFSHWKRRIRKHCPLTKENIEQIMADEWNNTTAAQLAAYYRHCGLTSSHTRYSDCPDPPAHKHDKNGQRGRPKKVKEAPKKKRSRKKRQRTNSPE